MCCLQVHVVWLAYTCSSSGFVSTAVVVEQWRVDLISSSPKVDVNMYEVVKVLLIIENFNSP